MVDVRRVKLPGVGVLHTFVTDDGGKVGVIAHRSGHSDLITFADDEDGSDANKVSLRLSEDEAHTLAELLGGTQITESLTALDAIPGLSIDWFRVDYEDHIAGQPLGDPAPSKDFRVFPGDTLVVAGSPEKVAKAFAFFRTGESRLAGATESPPGS
jgi:TrkA domain protein